MKKKLIFSAAALLAASMLFGFDSAETADSLLQKMNEASKNANGVSMHMDMNIDAGLSISFADSETPSTIGLGLTSGSDIVAKMDPFGMTMDGDINLNMLGQGETIKMQMYMVSDEEGKMDMYLYQENSTSEESGWTHQQQNLGINIKELQEASASIDYSEWGINWVLDPAPADVNGTECYYLSTVIDAETLKTIMSKTEELAGESITGDENVDMVLSMLDGLKLKIEYYIDTTTYLPAKLHMDLNDTDLSALDQYAAMALGEMGEGSEIHIILNDFSVDADTNYGDVADITVPQEALDTDVTDLSEAIPEIAG